MMQKMVDAIRGAAACPASTTPILAGRSPRTSSARCNARDCSRCSTAIRPSTTSAAAACPGLEEVWDRILSSGKMLYGIAVDDAHYFKRPEEQDGAAAGEGWVYVRSPRLEPRAIVEALERGDFYSSTGVELQSVSVDIVIVDACGEDRAVEQIPDSVHRQAGRVLSEATTPAPRATPSRATSLRPRESDRVKRQDGVDPAGSRRPFRAEMTPDRRRRRRHRA